MISIITITFNAEKTLRRTMESVASQTSRDYEHIVVDGASRDRTLEIARSFDGVRILSEPDKGLYDAMNKGIALARGEYLLFLNAGDTFSGADVLEAYAQRAKKGDDIIFADTQIVDFDGKVIGPRHYSAPARLEKDSFAKGMLICHQAFMVKKSIAPQYDLQYRFSSDYDWTIRCINNADMDKCTNLNMVAINYLSDGLTDRNKYKSLRERYRVMAKHYGHFRAISRHLQLLTGKR
ncbi:MAG: glycosyltransferase [Muribaculaceae bacterium]|nr:glycosyltransferase [Muribaculaceae bacterium]